LCGGVVCAGAGVDDVGVEEEVVGTDDELDAGAEEPAPGEVAVRELAVVTDEVVGCRFGLLRSDGRVAIARSLSTAGLDWPEAERFGACTDGDPGLCSLPFTSEPIATPAPRPHAMTTTSPRSAIRERCGLPSSCRDGLPDST
jgi:hypothetical protein